MIPEQAVEAVKETYIRFGWGGRAGSDELIRAALEAALPLLMGVQRLAGQHGDLRELVPRLRARADVAENESRFGDAQDMRDAADAMGVQRREDVARALFLLDYPNADWGRKKSFDERHDTRSLTKYWRYADAVLALPHTGQPQDAVNMAIETCAKVADDHKQMRLELADSVDKGMGGREVAFIERLRASTADSIATAIRALTAAPSPRAEGEWQPIETAPKDGSAILLVNGQWQITGSWHPSGCWINSGPSYERIPADELPTHWRPLPAPPVIPSLISSDQQQK